MVLKIKKNHLFFAAVVLLIFFSVIYFSPMITKAEDKEGLRVPIIMYHQITKKSSRRGKYTVTYDEFKNDMLFLKEKGYTTVCMSDLISYVNGEKELPSKTVIITFDDGFESVYEYAYPLLKELDMCAVASIVGEYTNFFTENPDHNVSYSYMDWHEVKELVNSGVIEIQNHSYDLHKNDGNRKGISNKKDENVASYNTEVGADILKMQNIMMEKTGYKPNTLTLPFGAYRKETLELAKSLGFEAVLLCEEKINVIKIGDTDALYRLGRFNRASSVSTERFFADIIED